MPLTYEDFRQWLSAQAADAVVGERRNIFSCPLATYLNERDGLKQGVLGGWRVTEKTYYTPSSEEFSLPAWASAFVQRVDRVDAPFQMTAHEAFTTLEDQ